MEEERVYERLRGNVGPQLPCPDANHPGTMRLFTDMHFPRPDGRAALLFRDYIEPAENTNQEYPFILITGRLEWHFNTRTRTGRVPHINNEAPDNFINLYPEDAARPGINEEELVEVTSRRGTVRGNARLTDNVQKGTVFIPFHYGKALCVCDDKAVNLVNNPVYDIHSKQPEYKFSVVRVERIHSSSSRPEITK